MASITRCSALLIYSNITYSTQTCLYSRHFCKYFFSLAHHKFNDRSTLKSVSLVTPDWYSMGLVMYGPRHKINSTKATINKERHNFIIGIQNKIVRVNITIQLKQLQTEIFFFTNYIYITLELHTHKEMCLQKK